MKTKLQFIDPERLVIEEGSRVGKWILHGGISRINFMGGLWQWRGNEVGKENVGERQLELRGI